MKLSLPTFSPKEARAILLLRHATETKARGIVCFSSGNAGRALQHFAQGTGMPVLHIGPQGSMQTPYWHSVGDIALLWPGWLDCTSGHLPVPLMAALGRSYASIIGPLDHKDGYEVMCGSGETLVCLALAYPKVKFDAVYDDADHATRYDEANPLNGLVARLACKVHRRNSP